MQAAGATGAVMQAGLWRRVEPAAFQWADDFQNFKSLDSGKYPS